MKLKFLLFSTVLYFSTNYAQVKTNEPVNTSSSKIRVYTPTTSPASASKDNSYKWVVKTDLLSMIGGEFPIIGEYRIARKLSIEASVGMTYAFLPNQIFTDNEINSENLESKAGIGDAFRAGIKFYPSSDYDAIEGWNFGIQLFTKTLNREYIKSSGLNVEGLKNTKNKTGIAFIIGKQIFADSNITFESFVGIGIANVTREFYDNVYEGSKGYNLQLITTKETVPNFQLGCRLGFGN